LLEVEILRLGDGAPLHQIQMIVWREFGDHDWLDLPANEYRAKVAAAQDQLNRTRAAHHVAGTVRSRLVELLGSDDIMVQSNLYLRAARPNVVGQEAVGWHRESMYGCQPQALNVWMPVANCTADNSIKYVPGSATTPEDDLIFEAGESDGVAKGSPGHKIGLLYAPKRIVGGFDPGAAVPFNVPVGCLAVFPSLLIHGAAVNRSNRVRFSVDFRVISAAHVGVQKKSFAGGGEDFFVPLEAA